MHLQKLINIQINIFKKKYIHIGTVLPCVHQFKESDYIGINRFFFTS
jgi:hypothetical protein